MIKTTRLFFTLLGSFVLVMVPGCSTIPHSASSGHIQAPEPAPEGIPEPVTGIPVVPPPKPAVAEQTYSVVVTNVPIDELLFALARDARINIDVHPGLDGKVTLNAIDQTLTQILERVSGQVDIRYHFEDELLVVEPDQPYLHTYPVNYVNMVRSSSSENSVATQITSSGAISDTRSSGNSSAGGNSSVASVKSISDNSFWPSLEANIKAILEKTAKTQGNDAEPDSGQDTESGKSQPNIITAIMDKVGDNQNSNTEASPENSAESDKPRTNVIINRETGLVMVRASHRQHRYIQKFLDQLMTNAHRQVLIEATVVEVELSNQYQFGVDWSRIADNGTGISFTQDLLGNNLDLANQPRFIIDYKKNTSVLGNIAASVRMLEQFGNVKVLSSPKVMAINNQTALLKVVDNLVYFTQQAEITVTDNGIVDKTITSTPHTVAVGFVMSVTPQISPDQTVTLNMRPTISRVTSFVKDPNPILAENDIESVIPQIQVREMESILQVKSGQVAVLGGLIQDSVDLSDAGIPGSSQIKYVGDLFNFRNNKRRKSELVVFLRPRVITNLDKPVNVYADYLPEPGKAFEPGKASDWEAWN